MREKRRVTGALAALLCFAAWSAGTCVRSEEPKTPPPPTPVAPVAPASPATPDQPLKKSDEPPKPDGETVTLDPTQLSPGLHAAIDPPAPQAAQPAGPARVVMALPPLPDIVVKGYVETEGRAPSALLEIDGKMQRMVTEGSEISTHSGGRLIVRKCSQAGIDIEILQLKQIIHVK